MASSPDFSADPTRRVDSRRGTCLFAGQLGGFPEVLVSCVEMTNFGSYAISVLELYEVGAKQWVLLRKKVFSRCIDVVAFTCRWGDRQRRIKLKSSLGALCPVVDPIQQTR